MMNSKTEEKNPPLIEAGIHKDLQAFNTLIHKIRSGKKCFLSS